MSQAYVEMPEEQVDRAPEECEVWEEEVVVQENPRTAFSILSCEESEDGYVQVLQVAEPVCPFEVVWDETRSAVEEEPPQVQVTVEEESQGDRRYEESEEERKEEEIEEESKEEREEESQEESQEGEERKEESEELSDERLKDLGKEMYMKATTEGISEVLDSWSARAVMVCGVGEKAGVLSDVADFLKNERGYFVVRMRVELEPHVRPLSWALLQAVFEWATGDSGCTESLSMEDTFARVVEATSKSLGQRDPLLVVVYHLDADTLVHHGSLFLSLLCRLVTVPGIQILSCIDDLYLCEWGLPRWRDVGWTCFRVDVRDKFVDHPVPRIGKLLSKIAKQPNPRIAKKEVELTSHKLKQLDVAMLRILEVVQSCCKSDCDAVVSYGPRMTPYAPLLAIQEECKAQGNFINIKNLKDTLKDLCDTLFLDLHRSDRVMYCLSSLGEKALLHLTNQRQ